MCGIVVVLDPTRRLQPETVDRMRDQLAHRGPDGAATWMAPASAMSVGLGHRRLAIVDLSEHGRQPMVSPDGLVAIVFNGMLYNFVELREELERAGYAFRTRSDTEVLLASYLVWGRDCLPRLNGMYAFVVHDGRDDTVFVARDRFGEKPLYSTTLPGGGRAFASEVKALLAHPGVRSEVNEEALNRWLVSGYVPPDHRVFFAGIEEVPPAHSIVIDCASGSERSWRHWTPDYAAVDCGIGLREASDELVRRFDASVRMRLRSDVPVGAFLSGGQDSSAIVAALWEYLDDPSKTTVYSARFDDDPSISEGAYIDAMLREKPFPRRSVSPDPELLAATLDRVLWHHEQPVGSASMFLEWEVLRDARENGSVVMLDGQGADELLGGYEYYFTMYQLDLALGGDEARLRTETRRFRERLAAAAAQVEDPERRFGNPSMSDAELAERRRQRERGELPPLSPADVLPGIPSADSSGYFRRQLARGMLYESLPLQLHSGDRNAMAFGVETRFPFLDYDLVDWVTRLPDDFMIRWGWHKYLLRTATYRRVPEAIRWRRDKVGFMAPQDAWLHGPLREWADALLTSGPIVERPEYRRFKVRKLWREHRQGKANHSDTLWRFLAANRWLQLWNDGAWSPREAPAAPDRTIDRDQPREALDLA